MSTLRTLIPSALLPAALLPAALALVACGEPVAEPLAIDTAEASLTRVSARTSAARTSPARATRSDDGATIEATFIGRTPSTPAGGDTIDAPGPGGLPAPDPGYANPFIGPWTQAPVVYDQYVARATSAGYGAAWGAWRDQGYHPAIINAESDGGPTRYTGVWHKNNRVVNWSSLRNMSEAEYLAEWQSRADAGWRLLDLDAHTDGTTPVFHAIWVEDRIAVPWRSHRALTRVELEATIESYRDDGFRPTRINAYRVPGGYRYAAVWIDDGRTDFIAHVDLSGGNYAQLWDVYRAHDYAPVDIAPYRMGESTRYAGIWLAEDGLFDDWASRRNMTAEGLAEQHETYVKRNLVLVDLDGYTTAEGENLFTAIWQRPKARRVISSNLPTAGDADLAALRNIVDGFELSGPDSRRGSIGAFVQDLQTGDYVGYNMHEPFYLASTTKVLIGARVAAHPGIDPADTYAFDSTMWRGESTRGFTQNVIGTNVTVATFMANMIQGSDTASTDFLWGLIASEDGPLGLQDWLHDAAGMQNVGEITDICEVDRRISAGTDACVWDVSCDTYMTFFRGGDANWNATAAESACLGNLVNHRTLENHEDYYTGLANTSTPAEFGRFFYALAQGDLMTDADRGELLQAMDAGWNDSFNADQGVVYNELGTKNGGKRRVSTQVGMMWDWDGVVGDHSDITPRYAFVLVTEDWDWETGADADANNTQDDTDWARAAMRGVLGEAIDFLQ